MILDEVSTVYRSWVVILDEVSTVYRSLGCDLGRGQYRLPEFGLWSWMRSVPSTGVWLVILDEVSTVTR